MNSATNVFALNLACLRRKQPLLADLLSNYLSQNETSAATIRPARSGDLTAEIIHDNRRLLLHSAFDPRIEAARLVENFSIAAHSNVVVLGFGLGYHVEELAASGTDRDFIYVVEKDIATFCLALEHRDLHNLIERPNVFFCIADEPHAVFRALRDFSLTIKANGLSVVKHPPSVQLHAAYYSKVLKALDDIFVWANVNIAAQINSGGEYTTNVIKNIPQIVLQPGVQQLFGAFRDAPAIIVSAGPSLNKNIGLLREAKGRCVLIAVDTALKPLLNLGIEPDLVVSIDFTPHNYRYFQSIDASRLCLVADAEIYPPILQNFAGKTFVANLPGKAICDWLASIIGDKGSMNKGLSVAHTAFELAVHMGCNPAILVGQDLAFTGNLSHASGTAMARMEHLDATLRVPGQFGRPVPTSLSLNVFLKHFEELIQNYVHLHRIQIINATEGGARIEGARAMPLEHALAVYCRRNIETTAIIERAHEQAEPSDREGLLQATHLKHRQLDSFAVHCEEVCALLNQMKQLTKQPDNLDRLKNLNKKLRELTEITGAHRELTEFMRDNIVRELVLQAKKSSGGVDAISGNNYALLAEAIDKTFAIHTGLKDASIFLRKLLAELIDNLSPAHDLAEAPLKN